MVNWSLDLIQNVFNFYYYYCYSDEVVVISHIRDFCHKIWFGWELVCNILWRQWKVNKRRAKQKQPMNLGRNFRLYRNAAEPNFLLSCAKSTRESRESSILVCHTCDTLPYRWMRWISFSHVPTYPADMSHGSGVNLDCMKCRTAMAKELTQK